MRYAAALIGCLISLAFPINGFAQINADADADPKPVAGLLAKLIALNDRRELNRPEARMLLSGELKDAARDATWGPISKPDRIVMLAGDAAVVRLPATRASPDSYLFLDRLAGGRWTIHAGRSLALMGIPVRLRDALREKPSLTMEDQVILRNLELALSSDAELKLWFGDHRVQLEMLRSRLESAESKVGGFNRRDDTDDGMLLKSIGLTLATNEDGLVRLTIGGMVDNEVGFLHAVATKVPPIDPSEYIWIEPLGDDWYLYKTT